MAKELLKASLLTLFFMIGITVVGQSVSIKGTVTDTDRESIPGVTILVKGTTKGTITDLDGHYNLDVNSSSDVLVFSFIGMKTQEVSVGNKSVIDIQLETDNCAQKRPYWFCK